MMLQIAALLLSSAYCSRFFKKITCTGADFFMDPFCWALESSEEDFIMLALFSPRKRGSMFLLALVCVSVCVCVCL